MLIVLPLVNRRGWLAYKLLPTQLFQECCHSDLHSSLMVGYKSVAVILISVTGLLSPMGAQ